ncbi:RagB/SusD family nutrient uptake outer membrane protein [Dyadobacter sp. 32]|uniref:RagB/SusD family nutrient uptake outer membrane protein n=1 Tax=Dyadobacter sp. 32 TaxID=538966 RepID=UPI0011EE461E
MKIKYYILALLFTISISSCEKFLDTEPTDFLSPSNYYETEQQLQYARAGVYSILGNNAIYGNNSNYLLAWSADEGYMNRATLTTGPWNYFYSTADQYNAAYWANLYNGINRANVLLANLDKNPTIPQEKRDVIRGETLFLRGFFYFMLVQYYGGVPIRTEPTISVEDVDIPKATVRAVYDQILADMTQAEPLVPGIQTLGFGGAISKSAVRGLLARVNLTMAGSPLKDVSRYPEAKKWAKMIIDDAAAAHALNPSYPQIFKNLASDKYDIKESIWEIEFWGNLTDEYTETTNQGWINGPASLVTSATGRADSYMSITAKFYNIFEPGDLRKWFSIAHFAYANTSVNGEKTMAALPATELAKYALRPAKWRREYETLLPKSATRTPQNVPVLRYTDVLLMYAEAENAISGPTPEIIGIINSVRQRSWSSGVNSIQVTSPGSGYTSAPTVTFTGGGSGAAATATINAAGQITGINLTRDLAGVTFFTEGKYTSAPVVTITGGGGTGATAVAKINSLTEANLKTAQTASKESLLAAIQDERMREFNYEGLRKADLLRWGIFLQTNRDMGNTAQQDAPGQFYVRYYTNVSERDLLSPIPTSEMTVNQGIEQNPGW